MQTHGSHGVFPMIDLQRDELLSLAQLARRLPSASGRRVNPSSCFRWAVKGLRGHKLEVVHVASRMLTTWQAYVDFTAKVPSGNAPDPAPTQSPRQQKRIRNAKKILADAGCAS